MRKPNVREKNLNFFVETASQRILEVLFKFPDREFSLSDLAKEARVSKAHIGSVLDGLLEAGFVQIEELSKIWRIRANGRSWQFINAKILYNLNFIYQSGLVEMLNEFYEHPRAIVLFGSFRKGEDITSSDIDIAVETDKDILPASLSLRQVVAGENERMAKQIRELEKFISRKIQVFVFNRKGVDVNVFNNIANGIVLFGFLEVKP